MGRDEGSGVVVGSLILVAIIALFIVWLVRRVPPKHAPGQVPITKGGIARRAVAAHNVDPSAQVATAPELTREQAIEQVGTPEQPPPNSNGRNECIACGETDPENLIEFEDWQQVHSVRGRVLARMKKQTALVPGRKLYTARGYCRSCGAIADHEDQKFEAQLALDNDVKRRVWERKGRRDAVRRVIARGEKSYTDEQAEIDAGETRAHARTFLET